MAMILFFIAIAIVGILVYLLLNPQKNLFDGLRGLFRRKSKGGVVTKGQPKSALGQPVSGRPQGAVFQAQGNSGAIRE